MNHYTKAPHYLRKIYIPWDILAAVYKKPGIYLAEVTKVLDSSGGTVSVAVLLMVDLELVRSEPICETKFARKRLWLTENGELVYRIFSPVVKEQKLKEIEMEKMKRKAAGRGESLLRRG